MSPPRLPPELADDAVAEILLRLPPDDPAHLVRAALVRRPWRRVLADPAFRRRYRAFHRAPPLLGFLSNVYEDSISIFVSTTSFHPRGAHGFPGGIAVDCRHGRALLLDYTSLLREGRVGVNILMSAAAPASLYGAVRSPRCYSAPRMAAPTSTAMGIVFVGSDSHHHFGTVTKACVYASHTGAWSAPATISLGRDDIIRRRRSLLIGEALYFFREQGILRFDTSPLGD
ncbi:hypothetical protein C2845_PM03G19310 [Panicum miliaceum]|uniref:F-box domain-containing protein n=1 Tax=Panicum miliaceum TaxID=4540 RepID=A0A3L6T7I3_PANMI|nr:hypothetical protein C2845_PM03G19310 [Panicum miliaceum]